MYSVDHRDKVVELHDVPQSSVGAPCPMILAREGSACLAYFLEKTPPGWDGSSVRILDTETADEPVALVAFTHLRAHLFGPNDEVFSGHPLASRGLKPYRVFEIIESSWIRSIERMNSVHPYHRPELFAELRHFVFAFHDSTFECVSRSFSVAMHEGSVAGVLTEAFQGALKSS